MIDKILQSSQNPEKISLTVKGILLSLVSFIVLLTGATVGEANTLGEFAESIANAVGTIVFLIGQIQIIWGLFRKLSYNTN